MHRIKPNLTVTSQETVQELRTRWQHLLVALTQTSSSNHERRALSALCSPNDAQLASGQANAVVALLKILDTLSTGNNYLEEWIVQRRRDAQLAIQTNRHWKMAACFYVLLFAAYWMGIYIARFMANFLSGSDSLEGWPNASGTVSLNWFLDSISAINRLFLGTLPALAFVVLIGWILIRLILNTQAFQQVLMNVPVLGTTIRRHRIAVHFDLTALLHRCGTPLDESLALSSLALPHLGLQTGIEELLIRLRDGESFARSASQNRLIDEWAIKLLSALETQTSIDQSLAIASDLLRRDSEQQLIIFSRLAMQVAILAALLLIAAGIILGAIGVQNSMRGLI